MLRAQFIRAQYRNLEPFREHVDNLVEYINASKLIVDLQPLFFKLTLDTTTALLLGRSVYSLRAETDADADNVAFAEDFNTAQWGLAKRFRLAPLHFFYNPPSFRHACSRAHRFVERYIEKQAIHSHGHVKTEASDSFLAQLTQQTTSKSSIRDQLLSILLAGRDSTASCLTWTM